MHILLVLRAAHDQQSKVTAGLTTTGVFLTTGVVTFLAGFLDASADGDSFELSPMEVFEVPDCVAMIGAGVVCLVFPAVTEAV